MKYFLVPFLFFMSCFVFGQKTQNKLNAKDLFNKSKIYFDNEQYDSAYFYSRNSINLFKNLKNDSLTIASALLTARSRDIIENKDTIDYIGFSEKIALKNSDWKSLIEIYFTQGNYLYNQSDYTNSLPVFLKIDSIAKANNYDNFTTIKSLIKRAEISRLTFTNDSTNLAYKIAQEALSRAKKINSQEGIHYTYVHLADLAQLRNDFGEAKKYIDLALAYYLKVEDEKWVSRMYLINSAYYLGVDNIEKADESRYKAIQYLNDKKNDYEMAKAKYYYGHFLRYYRNDCEKAIAFLEDSKVLHQKVNKVENDIYQRCLRDLAICYDSFGSHEKSKNYYKQAYELNIELTKKANRDTSRRLETKYQTEKKEQEITL
ncbi:MAG: tetratricopeptide repeat protein [Flavobacteriaceae bacterium]